MAAENLPNQLFIPLANLEEAEKEQIVREHFTGDMLRWAGSRALQFGDVVAPKVIYVESMEDEVHRVAWVEHAGVNTATYEMFHNHHIVCDCVLCKNFNDGKGGIDTSLCEVMSRALDARAQMVGAEFQRDIAISQTDGLVNVMTGALEKSKEFDIESFAVNAIEQVLRLDGLHPEAWHGNSVSGSLSVEEASKIIEQPLPIALSAAEKLKKSGRASFDGETVRLAA